MRTRIGLNAAPFAALLLILTAVTAALPRSKGLPLRVAELVRCGADDRRTVVIVALSGGRVKINVEEVKRSDLGMHLEAIFRTRAERVAFVTAEADLPLAEVADVIATATTHLDQVALLPSPGYLLQRQFDVCLSIVPQISEIGSFAGKAAAAGGHR